MSASHLLSEWGVSVAFWLSFNEFLTSAVPWEWERWGSNVQRPFFTVSRTQIIPKQPKATVNRADSDVDGSLSIPVAVIFLEFCHGNFLIWHITFPNSSNYVQSFYHFRYSYFELADLFWKRPYHIFHYTTWKGAIPWLLKTKMGIMDLSARHTYYRSPLKHLSKASFYPPTWVNWVCAGHSISWRSLRWEKWGAKLEFRCATILRLLEDANPAQTAPKPRKTVRTNFRADGSLNSSLA